MQPELTEQVVEPESSLAAARRQAASWALIKLSTPSTHFWQINLAKTNDAVEDLWWSRDNVYVRRDKSRSMLSWSAAHSAYT